MKTLSNAHLNRFIDEIEILCEKNRTYFSELLIDRKIDITEDGLIDWDQIQNKFSFFFNYENCEDDISELMSKSLLFDSGDLIIEIGYDEPVIKINANSFIKNWYDYFAASGFMGISFICEKHNYFGELTDKEFNLISNFRIR